MRLLRAIWTLWTGGEHILCAAIWADDGVKHAHQPMPTGLVFCGHRHHNVFAQLAPIYGFLVRERRDRGVRETQGFLTSTGRYVDREEAKKIAVSAGQVLPGRGLLGEHKLDSGDLY